MTQRTPQRKDKTVSEDYLNGIKESREILRLCGDTDAEVHFANAKELCKRHAASSPVGQLVRGERDFWLNYIRISKPRRK